jgi:hypothetical protein
MLGHGIALDILHQAPHSLALHLRREVLPAWKRMEIHRCLPRVLGRIEGLSAVLGLPDGGVIDPQSLKRNTLDQDLEIFVAPKAGRMRPRDEAPPFQLLGRQTPSLR